MAKQTKQAHTTPSPDLFRFPARRDEAPHGDLKVRDAETAFTNIKTLGYMLWSLPPDTVHEDVLHAGYMIMELSEAGIESLDYGRDK